MDKVFNITISSVQSACPLEQFPFCGSTFRIALTWIPCAIYWLCMPWASPGSPKASAMSAYAPLLRWPLVFKAPTISLITVLCALCCLLTSNVLILIADKINDSKAITEIAAYSPVLLTLIFEISQKLRSTSRNSYSCWLFLVAIFMMGFPKFVFSIVCLAKRGDCFDGIPSKVSCCLTFVLFYFVTFLSIIVISSAKSSDDQSESQFGIEEPPEWPEKWFSLPSRLYFTWFGKLIWKGYKRTLEINDIFQIDKPDSTELVSDNFLISLNREFGSIVKQKSPEKVEIVTNRLIADEINSEESSYDVQCLQKPSTFRALCNTFGFSVFLAGLLKFVCDVMHFAEPYFLTTMITFCTDSMQPWWNGVVYVGVMCFVMLIRSHLLQQYFYRMNRIGVRCRTGLISAVYKKSLKMSSEARSNLTTGEIVNLMSVDAGQFKEASPTIQMIWSGPFQIIVALFCMWQVVGNAVFAALIVLLTIFTANLLTCKVIEKMDAKQMKEKDNRMKLLSELLSAMKVIKLYAWEQAFQRRIENVRQKEMNYIKKSSYLSCVSYFSWSCAQFAVCTSIFYFYNGPLTPSVVFSIVTLFSIMEQPLSMLPSVLANIVMLRVSLKRFDKLFAAQELPPLQNQPRVKKDSTRISPKPPILVQKATFSWQRDFYPVLSNIDLDIPAGSLVAVVGKVGSGKSSLLSALCGELLVTEGTWRVEGSIAYASQQAWIQNLTVRDNITFGKPFNQVVYDNILEICALNEDLKILPAGDATEIGERGINLSGGQKQRISLARAVYQDCDIYLLDDPLSAVDIHVGRHIFDKLIGPNGILKNKTRVLVTHGLCFSPACDLIVVVNEGNIEEIGTFRDLVEKDGAFSELVQQYFNEGLTEEEIDELRDSAADLSKFAVALATQRNETSVSLNSLTNISKDAPKPKARDKILPECPKMTPNAVVQKPAPPAPTQCDEEEEEEDGTLIIGEQVSAGRVSWSVFVKYFKASGPFLIGFVLLISVTEIGNLFSHIWLQHWSDSVLTNLKTSNASALIPLAQNGTNFTTRIGSTSSFVQDNGLLVYSLMGVFRIVLTVFTVICFAKFQVSAGTFLHNRLLGSILNAPMAFFETTPLGRILNRCGRDIHAVDDVIPSLIDMVVYFACWTMSSLTSVLYATPLFVIALVPGSLFFFWLQQLYVSSSRQFRRLEAVTRSPVYSHFQETLNGVMTIRAFGRQSAFVEKSNHLIDQNNSLQMCTIVAIRWLGARLDLVSVAGFATVSTIVVILRAYGITPGAAGLAITFVMTSVELYTWGVQQTSAFETEIVAVERISEYCDMPSEDEKNKVCKVPSKHWPDRGRIEFRNFSASHRPGLPLVLKNLSLTINSGEKIGIVGRTGAGKSSLALALFRLIEKIDGQILIDGVDISSLNLQEVRRRLTIIPQEPALFSGTFRSNLDPFNLYSDEEIQQVIELSGLQTFMDYQGEGLALMILENGSNLSVGIRQLVCLARAILRKPKILVLDEATAAVDVETDAYVQETIRNQFRGCTILTIAHRVNTVIDYDRVLVLDDGKVAEFDTPNQLLARENGIFYKMVYDTNYNVPASAKTE